MILNLRQVKAINLFYRHQFDLGLSQSQRTTIINLKEKIDTGYDVAVDYTQRDILNEIRRMYIKFK